MGQFTDDQNTKQKGGRIARGVRKGERSPLTRWVIKGSVSIKLGLERVQENANEVIGTKPVSLI